MKPKCCFKAKSISLGRYPRDDISRSGLLKYFTSNSNSSIHVYLKVDRQSITLIPINFDKILIFNLKEQHCQAYSKKWNPNPIQLNTKYSDTFDFPEAEIPEGFKLNLRSYQLRSISWMKEIESVKPSESNTITFNILDPNNINCFIKAKLGKTPYYVAFNGSRGVTKSAETAKIPSLRFYGGVLADDTGSGKTATTLGLIHSSRLDDEKYQLRSSRFLNMNNYIQTEATLIVCPSNIHKQWISEANKCNPKFKIYGFSTILDHRKVSVQNIIEADIVVISYQFLTNSSYNNLTRMCRHALFSHVNGFVNIHDFHYHRMVLDEFHELESASKQITESIKRFSADYVWGLTGTPNSDTIDQILTYSTSAHDESDFQETRDESVQDKRDEIEFKHLKRNVPNLELPPVETEIVWIDLSAHELALLHWKGRGLSKKEEIMMCSHYQLNERESVPVNQFTSIENSQMTMSKNKSREIAHLKEQLINLHVCMEALKPEDNAKVNQYRNQVKSVEQQLSSAQSNFNYFQNVFKVIGEPDKNECLICYDTIPGKSLSILPCSHLYCYECIRGAIKTRQCCPLCRSPAGVKDIFCIRIKEKETVSAAPSNIDTSMYSSKLIGLYRYITNLINTDITARIILFLQFSDLADFIGKSFKDFGVDYVRVAGNVFQRQNVITKFHESKNIRLIMMSSED